MSSKLLTKEGDSWVVHGKKYRGIPLEKVAETDLDYLKWMYEKASANFEDDAFYALEDAIKNREQKS